MIPSIKLVIRLLMLVVMLPLTSLFFLLGLVFNKDSLISSFSQLLSLLPGKLGSYLRVGFYQLTMSNCASDVVISFATLFSQQDTEIAAGVYVGPQCNIGKCTIKKNCLLGSGVHIMSGKGQHNFHDINTPIKEQGGIFEKVTIGENSWIGNNALIMANIGSNCVVAAGSVVINDIPNFAVVAGNPAKIVKMRNE